MKVVERYFSSCCKPLNTFPLSIKDGVLKSMELAYKYSIGEINEKTLANRIVLWTDIKNYRIVRQEPYALLFRLIFRVKKNGHGVRTIDLDLWKPIITKIEFVIKHINDHGSIFAKTIFNESIAHRYANYYILNKQYENKMKMHYLLANKFAVSAKLYKNIDSSLYWLARGYEYAGNIEEAYKYFVEIACRKGKRYQDDGQRKKIRYCKKKYKEYKEMFLESNRNNTSQEKI